MFELQVSQMHTRDNLLEQLQAFMVHVEGSGSVEATKDPSSGSTQEGAPASEEKPAEVVETVEAMFGMKK